MSQPLAIAPVFASPRAKGHRPWPTATATGTETDTDSLDHRLDVLIDRLEQLEFTVGRTFGALPDAESDYDDDRLSRIEARLDALRTLLDGDAQAARPDRIEARLDTLQDTLRAMAPDPSAIALDQLAEDFGARHDAMLDMVGALESVSSAAMPALAASVAEQGARLHDLQAAMSEILATLASENRPADTTPDSLLHAIEDLAERQATAQNLMVAQVGALERTLVEDAFDALSLRVGRLVDARIAAGHANLADALERALGSASGPADKGTLCRDDTANARARGDTADRDESRSTACRAQDPRCAEPPAPNAQAAQAFLAVLAGALRAASSP